MGPKKKIGIYGGHFDPPTNAHLLLAAEVLHHGNVDELWLCPTGPQPDKTPARHRYAMCEIAVSSWYSSSLPVSVTDVELDQVGNTYNTLCALRDKYPNCEFSFVVGSDWLPDTDLRKWDDGEKLIKEFDILVMKRPSFHGEELEGRFKEIALKTEYKLLECNSTEQQVQKRARRSWVTDGSPMGLDG